MTKETEQKLFEYLSDNFKYIATHNEMQKIESILKEDTEGICKSLPSEKEIDYAENDFFSEGDVHDPNVSNWRHGVDWLISKITKS